MQIGNPSAFVSSSLGHILRTQRIEQGLAVEDVASRVRLPVGIVETGSVSDDRTASIGRVAIGNPVSMLVFNDGEPIDLAPFREAEQARFALSSRGQPTLVRG